MADRIGVVTKNSFFVVFARIAEFVVGLIMVILAARYFGVDDFGLFAFVSAAALVFSSLCPFGSLRILIREMSIDTGRIPALLSAGIRLNVLMAIVIMMLATVTVFAFGLQSWAVIISLYIASFTGIIKTLIRTIATVFIAHEKMEYDALVTIFSRILVVIFIFIVIYADFGFIGFFIALAVANTAGLFLSVWIASKKFLIQWYLKSAQQLKYIIIESAPIAVSMFLYQGYTYLNVFILKLVAGAGEIALYQAPQRVIMPLLIIPRSCLLALVPLLSRMANVESSSGLEYTYGKLLKYSLIISLYIAMWGAIFPQKLILPLFGKDFLGAAASLQIQIWVLVPLFANLLLDVMLTVTNRQRLLIISNAVTFVITLVIGLVFVPTYRAVGGSWALLGSSIILFTVNYYFVSKNNVFIPLHTICIRPLLGLGITTLLLYLIADMVSIWVLIPAGFMMYAGLLVILKTFSADEVTIFKELAGRVNVRLTSFMRVRY